jgi:hypothetical protein
LSTVVVPVEEQSITTSFTGEDSGTATGADNMQGGGTYIVALAWGKAELGGVCQCEATGCSYNDVLQARRVLGTVVAAAATAAAGCDMMRSRTLWRDAVVHAELEEGCYADVATRWQARARWWTNRWARRRTSGRRGVAWPYQ